MNLMAAASCFAAKSGGQEMRRGGDDQVRDSGTAVAFVDGLDVERTIE